MPIIEIHVAVCVTVDTDTNTVTKAEVMDPACFPQCLDDVWDVAAAEWRPPQSDSEENALSLAEEHVDRLLSA